MHGKSASKEDPFGIRREQGGNIVAPRSLRKKGKFYMSSCTEAEVNAAMGINLSEIDSSTKEKAKLIRMKA